MTDRRPVIWLPIQSDWESSLAEIGTESGEHRSWTSARDTALDLLWEASPTGDGVLVLSSLATARRAAADLGVDLADEQGRAAVAVKQYASRPLTLGLQLAIGQRQDGRDKIGWVLIDEGTRTSRHGIRVLTIY